MPPTPSSSSGLHTQKCSTHTKAMCLTGHHYLGMSIESSNFLSSSPSLLEGVLLISAPVKFNMPAFQYMKLKDASVLIQHPWVPDSPRNILKSRDDVNSIGLAICHRMHQDCEHLLKSQGPLFPITLLLCKYKLYTMRYRKNSLSSLGKKI